MLDDDLRPLSSMTPDTAQPAGDPSRATCVEIDGQALFLVTRSRKAEGVEGALSAALGYPAPTQPLRSVLAPGGDGFCLRFAPHQWLIGASPDGGPSLLDALRRAVAGRTVSVFDFAGGLACFRVAGDGARQMLAKGSLLDFRDAAFPAGRGTRTLFAEQAVIILRRTRDPVYDLYCDRSVAFALGSWLRTVGSQMRSPV